MPVCKKCSLTFPNAIVIDGVRRKLDTRKFCLECNPYKSGQCRNLTKPFKDSKRKQAEYMAGYYQQRIERKATLVAMKGGRCQTPGCGYSRCLDALCFHHRDRSTKEFDLTKGVIWAKPWNKVLAEAEKCDLLCLCCHAEKHASEKLLPLKEHHVGSLPTEPI